MCKQHSASVDRHQFRITNWQYQSDDTLEYQNIYKYCISITERKAKKKKKER